MTTIEQAIGANIRKLRKQARLSQTEFGERVGAILGRTWFTQTVSLIEKGSRPLAVAELAALCIVLDTTVPEVLAVGEVAISDSTQANVNRLLGSLPGDDIHRGQILEARRNADEALKRLADLEREAINL